MPASASIPGRRTEGDNRLVELSRRHCGPHRGGAASSLRAAGDRLTDQLLHLLLRLLGLLQLLQGLKLVCGEDA